MLLFSGIAALVLWIRARSQWLLLAAALYLGISSLINFSVHLPRSYVGGWTFASFASLLEDIGFLCLILLIAGLPSRIGIRGARFWWRASLALYAIDVLSSIGSIVEVQIIASEAHPLLFHILDRSTELASDAFTLYIPVLLAACFIFSRLTLPRLAFLAAVFFSYGLELASNTFAQQATRLDWLSTLLHRPLLVIYGSNLTIFSMSRIVVLLAIVYAVSDQIGRQVARQRFAAAEMKAAQEIQQVLVPAAAEREAPGFAVSSVYRPASEVGGDFFQIIPLAGDGTLIVAGDVSGKGLRAAMTVSLVVGALRTLAEYDSSPAAVLAGLNRRLIGRTQGGFVTCCAVRIDSGGHAVLANAGHCQPYLEGLEVDLPNGLPLGIVENATYEELQLELPQGQQLTLLSDGVVEARNHHGELYGFDRLNQLMQQRPTAEHVANTAVDFGQDDDITVLTVTRLTTA